MIDFDNLRVNNIQVLLLSISQACIRDRTHLQRIYAQSCEHFITTLTFLIDIGVLLEEGQDITFSPKSMSLLNIIENSEQPLDILRSFLINMLVDNRSSYSGIVNDFLSRFTLQGNNAIFIPDTKLNLYFAGLRNFLIDLELVEYDHTHPQYLLRSDHLPPTKLLHEISPSIMHFHIQKCEELGLKAELAVLCMEQKRLSHYPELVASIDHVATRNVNAGYDILSYEIPENKSIPIPRYIEVKAVSQWDMEFYWTSNEINIASAQRDQYWLYLLPVGYGCSFLLKSLQIIHNPFETVFKAKNVWERECRMFKFWPISNANAIFKI